MEPEVPEQDSYWKCYRKIKANVAGHLDFISRNDNDSVSTTVPCTTESGIMFFWSHGNGRVHVSRQIAMIMYMQM